MFILQTTTAVLIAFLAVLAYNEVRNRLARGRSERKDLEVPPSPPSQPLRSDFKLPASAFVVNPVPEPFDSQVFNTETETYKQLYYKLHNLEQYPEILPECRHLLLSLLSSTLAEALQDPCSGILSVRTFSRHDLDAFLKAKDADVTNRWEQYLQRRKDGGSREMFGDREEAKWWLKQAAPVKYVDGAWLGHINKISTPFKYRHITKNAWQVMSEELGDGDLDKNHVHVYRKLMDDIGAGLPAADLKDFIHPRHEVNEVRCWKAAIAQLTISLFPHDFLPEALGFNMAYESLPLHLLQTVKELRELRLNPYYFELHISIDNADSGHAAMALAAVVDYITMVEQDDGEEAAQTAWKRVQAGYILAEGLPTTPESPSLKVAVQHPFPRNKTERAMLHIFAAKSFVAHKIHCNSRLKIGRRSLVDWLEPSAFKDPEWQMDFLHDLSRCKPWVVQGHSEKSRLVKELSWEGKMFGSFTEKEVGIVKAWIDELESSTDLASSDPQVYFDFSGRSPDSRVESVDPEFDVLVDYPVLSDSDTNETLLTLPSHEAIFSAPPNVRIDTSNLPNFLPLWFASCALLESLPSVPVRASDPFGSALIRVLRAQAGFDVEGLGVAGMDEVHRTDAGQAIGIVELGLEMCRQEGLPEPKSLEEAVALGNAESVAFARWMVQFSMRWLSNRDVLVGMAWVFMEVHEVIARDYRDDAVLGGNARMVLGDIAARERRGLEVCLKEVECDLVRKASFTRGKLIARNGLEVCT